MNLHKIRAAHEKSNRPVKKNTRQLLTRHTHQSKTAQKQKIKKEKHIL